MRWFLASVEGDFRSLSNRVMLADQARKTGTPVAAIPTGVATAATQERDAVAANPTADAPQAYAATTPLTPVPMRSTLPAPAAVLAAGGTASVNVSSDTGRACSVPGPVAAAPPAAPTSMSDQIKTVLALIGVIAVLYHAMRLLGTAVG